MHRTEIQKSDIQREFSRRRRNQLVLAGALSPVVIALVLYKKQMAGTIFGLSGQVALPPILVLIVGALIYSHLNWRCPACSKYLGRGINPRYCPHCSVGLRA